MLVDKNILCIVYFRTAVQSSHLWAAVLLVILIVCSSVIAFYLTWQHMLDSTKEMDKMDFLMFGPKKSYAGKLILY
jgi:hypothetical protein